MVALAHTGGAGVEGVVVDVPRVHCEAVVEEGVVDEDPVKDDVRGASLQWVATTHVSRSAKSAKVVAVRPPPPGVAQAPAPPRCHTTQAVEAL